LGDGCIFSNKMGICISGNSLLDKNYIEDYICPLIQRLFQIKPKIYYSNQSNSIRCVVYSKKLSEILIKQGFPKGKKNLANLRIPSKFFKDVGILESCIRGLVDTDGSISAHPNVKIALNISSCSKSLINSFLEAFKKINLNAGGYSKGINLYGKIKLEEYFKKVGSSNLRNILKYKTFKEKKYVPTSKEIETFLKKNESINMKLPWYGPMV